MNKKETVKLLFTTANLEVPKVLTWQEMDKAIKIIKEEKINIKTDDVLDFLMSVNKIRTDLFFKDENNNDVLSKLSKMLST